LGTGAAIDGGIEASDAGSYRGTAIRYPLSAGFRVGEKSIIYAAFFCRMESWNLKTFSKPETAAKDGFPCGESAVCKLSREMPDSTDICAMPFTQALGFFPEYHYH
jgi:hypothetical protein